MELIKTAFKEYGALIKLIGSLLIFAAFACCMEMVRVSYSGSILYIFLIWNLILAWIPLGCALLLLILDKLGKTNKLVMGSLGLLWFLFYPNAPYITTDLIHLKARAGVPYWFDQILISSFLLNGLLVGFLSLYIIHQLIEKKLNQYWGWLFVTVMSFLSSFGIYLGRYGRWNSWDFFSEFQSLMLEVADRVIHPMAHPRTYGMTLLFGLFLLMGYLIFRNLISLSPAIQNKK